MTDLVSQTFFARYPWPSWVLVGLVLVLLFITAIVVKNEHRQFMKYKKSYLLGELKFFVPPWWALKIESNGENEGEQSEEDKKKRELKKLSFERQDTFYEWVASIEERTWDNSPDFFLSGPQESFSPQKVLEKILQDGEIKIDSEDWKSLSTSSALFLAQTQEKLSAVIRIEGRGLAHGEERIYLDLVLLFLVLPHSEQKRFSFYQLTSRSSVLNGFVEGPYFEEMLKQLEISPTQK